MGLTWILVVIAGCAGLAGCIAAALLRPVATERRRLRPLANVSRLTALPEYRREIRLRTLMTLAVVALLLLAFSAAVIAGARPTGLPTTALRSTAGQPEDVMLCVAGSPSDPARADALRYFAERVTTFDTQRIGLTAPNRRVVPLTREYSFAAREFTLLAASDGPDGSTGLVSPVSYVDYEGGVEDLLALCISGFPGFDHRTGERRSIVYVGPETLRAPDEKRPALFTADRVRELATTAGVQVNSVVSGPDTGLLGSLADATGGQSFGDDADTVDSLRRIEARPPPPGTADAAAFGSTDSPEIPVLVALLATVALAALPLVRRR